MKLISPNGVRFSVSNEKGERLLRAGGFRRQGEAAPAASPRPAQAAVKAPETTPKRRTRSPKATDQ